MKKKTNTINWDKAIICGVALGYMASMLYLMLVLVAEVTA
jgi:hypothetical protein